MTEYRVKTLLQQRLDKSHFERLFFLCLLTLPKQRLPKSNRPHDLFWRKLTVQLFDHWMYIVIKKEQNTESLLQMHQECTRAFCFYYNIIAIHQYWNFFLHWYTKTSNKTCILHDPGVPTHSCCILLSEKNLNRPKANSKTCILIWSRSAKNLDTVFCFLRKILTDQNPSTNHAFTMTPECQHLHTVFSFLRKIWIDQKPWTNHAFTTTPECRVHTVFCFQRKILTGTMATRVIFYFKISAGTN